MKKVVHERTVPVALRFEASPELQRSLSGLLISAQHHLADSALRFYIAGDEELPVIFSGIDDIDDFDSAENIIGQYNRRLGSLIHGRVPYFRHFPVTHIEHHSSDDGASVDFAVHIGTTSQEMNYLRRAPLEAHIGDELTLTCRRQQLEMQPLSLRMDSYRQLRQALGRSSLYVTHPTAVTMPRHVDQHSQD